MGPTKEVRYWGAIAGGVVVAGGVFLATSGIALVPGILALVVGAGALGWCFFAPPPPITNKKHRIVVLQGTGERTVPREARASLASYQEKVKLAQEQTLETTHDTSLRRMRRASSVPVAAVDSIRKTLRFVAKRCVIKADGLHCEFEGGGNRFLAWNEIASLSARQLPPDPPFEKVIFFDIVPLDSAPLRLLASTIVNYIDLPQGAAANSRENFRRLAAHIQGQNEKADYDEDSKEFFVGTGMPPRFLAMKQFVAYDARFG